MSVLNPFWHGTPVPLEKFIGREEKLRSITSRISTGQSVAISGSPRSGKTSILYYLMAPERQVELYGDDADKLIFSYLDAALWDNQFDKTQFWREALLPLSEYIQDNTNIPPSLTKAYQTCQENEFGTFVLEKLFAQFKQINKHLILIVDGFDLLLHHPTYLQNSTEFFGGLRSVASHSRGTLAVIIAINLSVTQLTEKVQDFTRSGSPYFNFMDEVILGPLSPPEIDKLLKPARERFTPAEEILIKEMAGGHPYLLQVLASCLWEIDERTDSIQRQQQAVKDFYLKVEDILEATWHTWQTLAQQAFTSVALVQMEKLKQAFQRQGIDVESISKQIPRLKSELELLKNMVF
ncbi:MAG: ATP-binding protein [Thioploca sp.]|nr:ATP-binding protein [Thioploca sp.]